MGQFITECNSVTFFKFGLLQLQLQKNIFKNWTFMLAQKFLWYFMVLEYPITYLLIWLFFSTIVLFNTSTILVDAVSIKDYSKIIKELSIIPCPLIFASYIHTKCGFILRKWFKWSGIVKKSKINRNNRSVTAWHFECFSINFERVKMLP